MYTHHPAREDPLLVGQRQSRLDQERVAEQPDQAPGVAGCVEEVRVAGGGVRRSWRTTAASSGEVVDSTKNGTPTAISAARRAPNTGVVLVVGQQRDDDRAPASRSRRAQS